MPDVSDLVPLEGYDSEVGLLLASLAGATRKWRAELGEPSIEAMVWQPARDSQSIGCVILHLADSEAYWLETFLTGKRRKQDELRLLLSKETQQYGACWPTPPSEPLEWYFGIQDRVRARVFEGLKGVRAMDQIVRKSGGTTVRRVIAHVAQHDAYHGGQAVLLHELWKKLRYPPRN